MENIDKIINIRVKYSDLIKGMSESAKRIDTLNDRISELKSGLKGLKAARKAGTIDKEAYNEQVAQTTQELIANREEVKALQSAMRLYSREIQDNIKEEKNLEGSVNGLRKSIRDLTAQYNALSAADREGSVGNGIAERISKMQAQVSAAEQRLGNFRSNVGNYQSAFNGLNVSVSQIVRELPSATMGANMFFLAISNNIPMLVDEINKLRAANKLAMKEGKQGVPILKQMGAAVFSWNSLVSVGITLLTVYGKDIVSWIGNLFKGREAAMTMAEAQAEVNKQMAGVNKQMAEYSGIYGDQVAQLRALQLQWNQLGDDLKAKTEFVKKNQEAFHKLGVKINDTNDAERLLVERTDDFVLALQARAKAAAAQKLASEEYESYLKVVAETEDELAQAERLKSFYVKQKADREKMYSGLTADIYQRQIRASQTMINQQQKIIDNIQEQRNAAMKNGNVYAKLQNQYKKQATDILNQLEIKEYDPNSEKVEKDALKAAKTRAKSIKEAKDAALKAEKDYFQLVQQMRTKTKESELKSISEQNSVAKKSAEKRISEIDILLKTAEGEQAAWLLQEKETLNKRILALDEKYQKDRISVEAKYSEEALRKELAREEARIRARLGMDAQMDALARAQVKNENYSDLKSEDNGKRLSAQRAIAQEELRIAMDKYQALLSMDEATKESLYDSDVAYQTAVLNGEMAVQDAKLETARITKEQAEYQLNTTLTAMSTISGAAANLFNTLAEDNAEFAEFAKLLALFNIGVNTALAISEAIAGNAARPIKMAAAIAAVLSAIAQAYQVLNQAEKPATPKFSRGGLVTGPGTGTSDSIPARLSNGEAVMTARAVVDWGPVLSMMNVSSGGNAIPTSHLPERRAGGMREMEQMLRRVMREMPNPVVTVRDINNGQRRVKVQDETARYAGRKR
ncbi:hypothetical protein [Alistipes communis]|uniref:hypothetical protein n=1 Tax=Alistipes communis TaxID=2585118 RepID=UPI003520A8A6